MQSLTWNRPTFAIAGTPAQAVRTTIVAIFSTSMATALAVMMVPDKSAEAGALFYPALVLSAGLVIGPLSAALRNPKALLRGESLLALAPIYCSSICCKAYIRWTASRPTKSARLSSPSDCLS
jgi:hypothetical protein